MHERRKMHAKFFLENHKCRLEDNNELLRLGGGVDLIHLTYNSYQWQGSIIL
jgi:hypothetical protein